MFFKERLSREDGVLRGVMCVIPSAVAAQAIAAAGADFIVIDREHGPIGRETMHAMIAATAGAACSALVRVPAIDEAEVKAALDAGAEGIVYPLVRSAEDVQRCVAYLSYPPTGSRGWGPFVAHSQFGTSLREYSDAVGPHVTCCVLIETVEAIENIDAILEIPGLDLVVVAPFDLTLPWEWKGNSTRLCSSRRLPPSNGPAKGRFPSVVSRSPGSRAPPSLRRDTAFSSTAWTC